MWQCVHFAFHHWSPKIHFCSCQLRLAINPGELWNILQQILRLLCLARLQESAHWLAVRGRLIEARIVLEHMAKKNGTLGISKSLDKFTDLTNSWDKSSFHHPRKAHILRKLGPPPSYDLSLLYNVTGITARQTSRDWSANFLNSLHSNQAVWICLISFKFFHPSDCRERNQSWGETPRWSWEWARSWIRSCFSHWNHQDMRVGEKCWHESGLLNASIIFSSCQHHAIIVSCVLLEQD